MNLISLYYKYSLTHSSNPKLLKLSAKQLLYLKFTLDFICVGMVMASIFICFESTKITFPDTLEVNILFKGFFLIRNFTFIK